MKFAIPTKAYLEARRKERAAEFPSAHFGAMSDISPAVRNAFRVALADGSEEAIQKTLTANPYLIQYAVDNSGHHGIWIFPKPMIRPQGAEKTPGLVPDYLVVTRSSLGHLWHIVELKRFTVQFARRGGRGLSAGGNKAIGQCNVYLSHFNDYIDAGRSNIRINELIRPKGAILLIGNSATENEKQREFRANFVNINPKIQVVSYQRIVSALELDLISRLDRTKN